LRCVRARPSIDLELSIDDEPVVTETTCTWAGAHVLTVHTVIPRSDLALELHSTFVGHRQDTRTVLGIVGERYRALRGITSVRRFEPGLEGQNDRSAAGMSPIAK